ncbi:MAG: cytochrome C [Thermodesulfobacteriota bacterium]
MMETLYKKCFFFTAAAVLAAAAFVSCNKMTGSESPENSISKQIKHGEYLVRITGCNDCHTTGYPESDGTLPINQWLTGSPLGWHGPWGTTYAPNLRLMVHTMTEKEWLNAARNVKARPPMPWYVLRDMSDSDLTAMYEFIKILGPAGEPMPKYVPPGQTPTGPYVDFPEAN